MEDPENLNQALALGPADLQAMNFHSPVIYLKKKIYMFLATDKLRRGIGAVHFYC